MKNIPQRPVLPGLQSVSKTLNFYNNVEIWVKRNKSPFPYLVHNNDPSAGSPTDTLLRLLLPLNDTIWGNSNAKLLSQTPYYSLNHSIGNSDGRCVQRPETYSTCVDDTYLLGIPRSWRIITIFNPQHDIGSKNSQSSRIRGRLGNEFNPISQNRQKTYWQCQCSARAAQNIWEHHGPFIAYSFHRLEQR